jgi:hypothetical protein
MIVSWKYRTEDVEALWARIRSSLQMTEEEGSSEFISIQQDIAMEPTS